MLFAVHPVHVEAVANVAVVRIFDYVRDRGRSWILLAAELASSGDTASALSALDSASIRRLSGPERTALSELLAALRPARGR